MTGRRLAQRAGRALYWTLTLQLPARIRERRVVARIWRSGLFDIDYYLRSYPDVQQSALDPVTHYVRSGAREGRDPSPHFDTAFYLAENPDVAAAGMNPLLHFLTDGAREGRAPKRGVDLVAYAAANPFIAESGLHPLLHYARIGPAVRPQRTGDSAPVVEGALEHVSAWGVRGWARNREDPDNAVVVDCFLDGVLYATVRADRFRGDLERRFGDHGHHGFVWDSPPIFSELEDRSLEVRPRLGLGHFRDNPSRIARLVRAEPPPWRGAERPRLAAHPLAERTVPAQGDLAEIELIVLNRNGATLLEAFFASASEFNTWQRYRITIVDHGSEDESEAVVRRWSRTLRTRWLARDRNYSFAESNNFAAAQSEAQILVFVNNDIEFGSDCLARVGTLLSNPENCVVGAKLVDSNPAGDAVAAAQHLGIAFDRFRRNGTDPASELTKPFEVRGAAVTENFDGRAVVVPAVTGAFLAMRSRDFSDLGGFHEGFFYGYEDVDLCLRVGFAGRGRVVCANDLVLRHERAATRRRPDRALARRQMENRDLLERRQGYRFRRQLREDQIARPGFWGATPTRIGFAVSEAGEGARAGDYFTALELARELEKQFACECVFLTRGTDWYDAAGIDALVSMVVGYDPGRVHSHGPHLLKVAWVRNWFDRFASDPRSAGYDLIWAASEASASLLRSRLSKQVEVLRIATAYDTFAGGTAVPALRSDYCFTGHHWNEDREVSSMLDHAGLPFVGKVFGSGWDQVEELRSLTQGPLPYAAMRDVYASARVVIDDANHTIKPWGSVNSRVFDALAAGALVLTNGARGSEEVFGGDLPTYASRAELSAQLRRFLGDEEERRRCVEKLRKVVAEHHTYARRAREVWNHLGVAFAGQLRVAIKTAVPSASAREEWGDYHFAAGLKRALDKLGFTTRIDYLDTRNRDDADGDDVAIALRGLTDYEPRPHQINLLWLISHPDKVALSELAAFDHVFVASAEHAERLAGRISSPVSTLLQCTDVSRFFPRGMPREKREVVFVGNSRKEFRRVVRDAIEAGVDVKVYGTNWGSLIPARYIAGEHVPNEELGALYSGSSVVLNDHWETMREKGFLSNRLFDAVAAGARVISDPVDGMEAVFGDSVWTYRRPEEIRELVQRAVTDRGDVDLERAAARVRERHTFDHRAAEIAEMIWRLDRERREVLV